MIVYKVHIIMGTSRIGELNVSKTRLSLCRYMLPVCYAGFIMHALTRQRYMLIHSNVALHHA